MSAKILAFDPNRKLPPRHYTPIAMRGQLLQMPPRATQGTSDSVAKVGLNWFAVTPIQGRR
jgi:hypothetical protein